MARGNFAGTGKLWINGTLYSEAAKISVTHGGKLNRQVTLGYTGETVEDPTMMSAKIDGAPLRSESLVPRLQAYRRNGEDVTLKAQVGAMVSTGRGKIGPVELSTENGKSSFSTEFMGDEQA